MTSPRFTTCSFYPSLPWLHSILLCQIPPPSSWPGAVLTDAFTSVGKLRGDFHEPTLVHTHAHQSLVHPSNELPFAHKHVECGSPVIAEGGKAGENIGASFTPPFSVWGVFFKGRELTAPRSPLAPLAQLYHKTAPKGRGKSKVLLRPQHSSPSVHCSSPI